MSRPNVLLFVFDTLRPDFLSCYQDTTRVETNTLDQLADDGVLFERAFSAGHHTRISHGSLFTGQYPSENGLITGHASISPESPYLPEHLSVAGYETFGITGPSLISSDYGFERGYDTYLEPYYLDIKPARKREYFETVANDPLVRKDFVRLLRDGEDDLTNLKFNYLERAMNDAGSDPFYGFINFTTVHSDYDPPRPYKEEITEQLEDVEYSRPRWQCFEYLASLFDRSLERLEGENVRPSNVFQAAAGRGGEYHGNQDWLTDEEMEILRTWYAGCLKYLDDQLGQFVEYLKESGQYEDTILLLTSDHGEYFGEHGLLYHGDFLFDQMIHIPLIITGGPVEPDRRSDLVSHIDVFDTVADLVDIESSPKTTGHSMFGGETRDAIFAEYGVREDYGRVSRYSVSLTSEELRQRELGVKCVRTDNYKLTLRSDGSIRLYSLPGETKITDPDAAVRDRLLERLDEELGLDFVESTFVDTDDITAEIEENLEDLGYI